MRHEHWDCPTFGFSTKPMDIFGKLMTRSFKETSFIHSLLSAAIAHSVTRACTESTISTCGRLQTPDGSWKENFEFGRDFAEQFMLATHELSPIHSQGSTTAAAATTDFSQHQHPKQQHSSIRTRSIDTGSNTNTNSNGNNNNNIPTLSAQVDSLSSQAGEPSNMIQPAIHQNQLDRHHHSSSHMEPTRKIRDAINIHNDRVGRLVSVCSYASSLCWHSSSWCLIHFLTKTHTLSRGHTI